MDSIGASGPGRGARGGSDDGSQLMVDAAPSPALRAALDALDAPIRGPADLEAYNLDVLRALPQGSDRETFAAELRRRLAAGTDDPRLVDALIEVGGNRAFVDLAAIASGAMTVTATRAARRLAVIRRDRAMRQRLGELLATGGSFIVSEALAGLLEAGGDLANPTIVAALAKQPSFEIRARLVEALFAQTGIGAFCHVGSVAFTVELGVLSAFQTVRAEATRTLLGWVERLARGESLRAIGVEGPAPVISAAADALYDAIRSSAQPALDESALDALAGGERAWIVDVIGGALEDGDPRAEAALRRLGGARAEAMLRDHPAAEANVDPESSGTSRSGTSRSGESPA